MARETDMTGRKPVPGELGRYDPYSSRVQQPWCMQADAGGRTRTSNLLKQLVRRRLPVATDQKVGGSSPSERATPYLTCANIIKARAVRVGLSVIRNQMVRDTSPLRWETVRFEDAGSVVCEPHGVEAPLTVEGVPLHAERAIPGAEAALRL